jgi:hypothetical protein
MVEPSKEKAAGCRCPFCDVVLEEESAICTECLMVIIECKNCGKPVREDAGKCPSCGEPPK